MLKDLLKKTSLVMVILMLMSSNDLVAQSGHSQLDKLFETLIGVNEAAEDHWWKWSTTPASWGNTVYHLGNMALYRALFDANTNRVKRDEYLERSVRWARNKRL